MESIDSPWFSVPWLALFRTTIAKVTPEPDFSYASFETNVRLPNYDSIVREVLEVFRPKKFTMTLFAEKTGMEAIKKVPGMRYRSARRRARRPS